MPKLGLQVLYCHEYQKFWIDMNFSKKALPAILLAAAFFLHGCAHQQTADHSSVTATVKDRTSIVQTGALARAVGAARLKVDFLVIEVPSANNAISNAMMTMWGMEGSLAAQSITNMVDSGTAHFGVTGDSAKVNMAAVQAALKAISTPKRVTDIFVFVGDSKLSERIDSPAGINVHLVRTDGSLWP